MKIRYPIASTVTAPAKVPNAKCFACSGPPQKTSESRTDSAIEEQRPHQADSDLGRLEPRRPAQRWRTLVWHLAMSVLAPLKRYEPRPKRGPALASIGQKAELPDSRQSLRIADA